MKRRNRLVQILLSIVTFGIYEIYWFYATAKKLVEYRKLAGSPILWTILLFTPFGSYWKHGKAIVEVTDSKYPFLLIYVLWLLFNPAVWLLTRIELNKLAEE